MDTRVLIAGAGPTGLTLAIELARRGVPCRIVDASEDPLPGSRGDGLQPRTLEVFDDLGVIDEILAAGFLPPPFRTYSGGKHTGELRMAEHVEPTPQIPYPNGWMVPQWRTEEILRDRLAELGVKVERSTALLSFQQDDDGVTATLTSGDVRAEHLVAPTAAAAPSASNSASTSSATPTRTPSWSSSTRASPASTTRSWRTTSPPPPTPGAG
ncbi:FAD binding domain-containing protein [Saccharopolyspora dendranthemae]|uniref:FAD binding domain-containing protein n=1 Tax=Saccharopolyspora dendranthemae TaxID=1181886 RepID=A0A561VBP0_9PSEU|nr:FAD-dependent monooxygenase [Saccharopolyspora dendranthemae]TWG09038.1 FAD binding domain-containing protein [Saccharopolyspora dendranthemae]